jgi:hypothetical protein
MRLDEVAPELLATIPIDPWSGKPFGYRLSKGENLPVSPLGADSWYERFPYELFPVLDAFRWFPLPGAPGTPWMTVLPVLRRTSPSGETKLLNALPGNNEDSSGPVLLITPHRWVAPGRAIIWSTGADRRDDGGKDESLDTIFLVPYSDRSRRN